MFHLPHIPTSSYHSHTQSQTRGPRIDPRLLCFLGTYVHTLLAELGVPADEPLLAFPSPSAEPALSAGAGAMLENVNALPWRLRPAEDEVR